MSGGRKYEYESGSTSAPHEKETVEQVGASGLSLSYAHSPGSNPHTPGAAAVAPPPKKGLFSMSPKVKSKRGASIDKSQNGSSSSSLLNQSISNSAPTVLINTTSSSSDDLPLRQPLRSAMSSRTLHDSLHRGRALTKTGTRMNRSVSFANVNIREYERILGDNPSVTSGPPLAIGWRYVPEPIQMNLDDYENGKGSARSSAEYLVPKSVRENLLREHADVSRREMVAAVRATQKEKAQRRKTVVNLSMQKTEERLEGAKRKIKKILKPATSYDKLEVQLWDNAHAVAMDKAKRLEESIRRGESVGMRNVYAVGTPFNNILPSRSNSIGKLEGSGILQGGNTKMEEENRGTSSTLSSTLRETESSMESLSKQYTPKPTTQHQQIKISSVGDLEDPLDKSSAGKKVEGGKKILHGGSLRTSSNIVASESESEEIFAKLLLDDAINDS